MAEETEGRILDPEVVRAGVDAVFQSQEHGFYLVAERRGANPNRNPDGSIVGGLLVTYEWSDWRNGTIWWIQSVYIVPEARRQGIYRALYAALKSEAAGRDGLVGIRLYVDRANAVAHTVYENLGMEQSRYDIYEADFVP